MTIHDDYPLEISNSMNNTQSHFLNHLLRRRLDRVSPEHLRDFSKQQGIDVSKLNTKQKLLDELMSHINIMKDDIKFNQVFNHFLRDFVLSAGVSEYILQVENTDAVSKWINSWKDNTFWGQKHKFEVHISRNLGQKNIKFYTDKQGNIFPELEIEGEGQENHSYESEIIYLPSNIIFLVASSLEEVSQLNGLEEVNYHRTSEFEVIFRKDLNLVEIRGEYQAIKDFVVTAVIDNDNPLSMASSLFIGEEQDTRNSLIRGLRARVGIDSLRKAINGSFLSITSIVNGSKASRVKIDLDELQNSQEETEPTLRELINKVQPTLDKGRISFQYKSKKYSFMITKTGGLRFYEYVPEEVVTYILYTINKIK
nr:hypothetical protein [Nostoc sp. EkiNYC01]